MNNTDGTITIGTQVDTKGIDIGLSSIEKKLTQSMNKMSNTIQKTFNLIKVGIVGAGIGFIAKGISSELNEAITRLDTMKNYENVMSNLGISGEDARASITRLSEALKGLPTTLDQAALSVQRFASANGNVKASTEMFLAMNNAILAGGAPMQTQAAAVEQLSQAYAKGKPDMMEWRTILQAMPAQLKQVADVMGYASSADLGEALRKGTVSMNEFMVTLVKMNKEGLNGYKSLEEQARNATGGIQTSMQNVRTAFARAMADIMDAIGRSNIVAFFDGIRNAIDRVVPYIVAFIRLIKTAILYVARFFGAKVQTDAKKTSDSMNNLGGSVGKTSDKLNNATGSAKKLKNELKQLADFDEMNVLKDTTDTSGGTGGTGATGVAGGIGDIDLSVFDDLTAKVSKSDEIFEHMIKLIKEINGLSLNDILNHVESIGNSLKSIFENSDVQKAAQNWVKVVINSLKSIVSSVAQIGLNIVDSFLGAIDKYLAQNVGRISNFIKDMFDISAGMFEIEAKVKDAMAKISEVFTGSAFEQIGADIIAALVNPIMSAIKIYESFILDLTKVFFNPIVENTDKIKTALENTFAAIQPLFDTLSAVLTYIGDSFTALYDEHLHPFFESLANGLSDTFGKFLDIYNEYIAPFVQRVSEKVSELWDKHLKPLWDNIMEFVGMVIDYLKFLWENTLKPIIDWIIQNIIPTIIPIIETIFNAVASTIGFIVDLINNLINVLKGIINFIAGVFTGDWNRAWKGIQQIFGGVWDIMKQIVSTAINLIKSIVTKGFELIKSTISSIMSSIKNTIKSVWNGIWNIIKGIINKIIGGVEKMCNTMTRGLNKVFGPLSDVGNKVLETVGIKGFKFNKINEIKLPKLAKGGIINLPSRGIPVGPAIGGERGAEGVIPLTDSQQMALLGEAIGRYITVNLTNVNQMNGRVLSREIKKIESENDFAFNR